MLSLEAVELLSRQVAALRVACVAAVADETPGGAATDRVLDEVSCARRLAPVKHEGGWRVEATSQGALRWTSPQGASAFSHPDD